MSTQQEQEKPRYACNDESSVYHVKDEATRHDSYCGRLVAWMAKLREPPAGKKLCKQCANRLAKEGVEA